MNPVPDYLNRYVTDQSDAQYTPVDHAVWRCIMRQSLTYFRENAVSVYEDGLRKTGISLDRIPSIKEIDRSLHEFGWSAVSVRGFIPPSAFLDFQARRILPIAVDMRTIDHIHYTPAPDIVHEAAGHAPIIADSDYANYLQKYAQIARRAIFSQGDIDQYEAIRTLSDVKENPDCSAEQVAEAEQTLRTVTNKIQHLSEAAKVARMNWWTVEYGLAGDFKNPKIYGAGLLSSVGESQRCLSPAIKKIPLDMHCVDYAYDITEPQPQLFVAEDIPHLVSVLESFEETLAFRRGGLYGLEQAKISASIVTVILDTEIEISGRVAAYETDSNDNPCYFKLEGPSQISHQSKTLPGQGCEQHAHGFSTVLGRAKNFPDTPLTRLDAAQRNTLGLEVGKTLDLELTTGFKISGQVRQLILEKGQLQIVKLSPCKVTNGSRTYFDPEWGEFDWAVGETIQAVEGGARDVENFGTNYFGEGTSIPGRTSSFTPTEQAEFEQFETISNLREAIQRDDATAGPGITKMEEALPAQLASSKPDHWLYILEAYRLMLENPDLWNASSIEKSREYLQEASKGHPVDEIRSMIQMGIAIAGDQFSRNR